MDKDTVANLADGIKNDDVKKSASSAHTVDVAGICEVCDRGILVPITALENEKGRTKRRFHAECRQGRKNRKRLKNGRK